MSAEHHPAVEHHPALAHHFDSLAQQSEATTLGMWVFLVTEVLFFGGLFATYMIYRSWYPDAFAAASHELDVTLGTINTVVLITSSLTMALAVHAAQLGQRRLLMTFLILTMVLGGVFLGIKSVEYYRKFVEHHVPGPGFQFETKYLQHAQLFFSLYFVMTGLHAPSADATHSPSMYRLGTTTPSLWAPTVARLGSPRQGRGAPSGSATPVAPQRVSFALRGMSQGSSVGGRTGWRRFRSGRGS